MFLHALKCDWADVLKFVARDYDDDYVIYDLDYSGGDDGDS